MKLTNLLEHPGLNQLRLSMGAESLAAPPRGWSPRLLDAEAVMRLGQPDPAPTALPSATSAPAAKRIKSPPAVPVHYSRDRTSSKILNPIGLPPGAVAADVPDVPDIPAVTDTPNAPDLPSLPQSAPPSLAAQTPEPPNTAVKPASPRRRRNQAALEKLRAFTQ